MSRIPQAILWIVIVLMAPLSLAAGDSRYGSVPEDPHQNFTDFFICFSLRKVVA